MTANGPPDTRIPLLLPLHNGLSFQNLTWSVSCVRLSFGFVVPS